jgi:hypothetical protein
LEVIAELQVYCCEQCVDFILSVCGYEQYYNSTITMWDNAITTIFKLPDEQQEQFVKRLLIAYDALPDIGYYFTDCLSELMHENFPKEDEEE